MRSLVGAALALAFAAAGLVGPAAAIEPDDGSVAEEVAEHDAPLEVVLTPVAQLDAPMAIVPRRGTRDLYVAERAGRVRRLVAGPDHLTFTLDPEPVLDLTARTTTDHERGLLSLVFSPDGGRLFVHFTNPDGDTRVVRYEMDGSLAVVGSRRTVLRVAQPFPNHNGGQIAFGPDRKLYVGLGDGGAGGDPLGHGQDTTTLLGAILRLDPIRNAGRPYRVPVTNPFVGGGPAGRATRPEIWLYGVRNPWRFSFDRSTGALWVADVGQESVEEIDKLPAGRDGRGAGRGANLGWAEMEGNQPYAGGVEPPGHVRPIFTYPHGVNNENGCSITGGFAYRGTRLAGLRGAYVYGDLCRAELRALRQRRGQVTGEGPLGAGLEGAALVGFAEDSFGELYTLGDDGLVSRLDPAP